MLSVCLFFQLFTTADIRKTYFASHQIYFTRSNSRSDYNQDYQVSIRLQLVGKNFDLVRVSIFESTANVNRTRGWSNFNTVGTFSTLLYNVRCTLYTPFCLAVLRSRFKSVWHALKRETLLSVKIIHTTRKFFAKYFSDNKFTEDY